MSHGGGQPSCTTVSLGKYVRRAFRAAAGKKKKRKKPKDPAAMARISSFSSTAMKESVVRVVLKGRVVEVYPGVVLACTVIRKHPPGLCLAHPDVFRNPHGAVVRPLEPLFPGQKFLLLPESTVIRLKQKIPESSIGAFADDPDDYSSGTTTEEEEEEEEECDTAVGDDGGFMAGCSAREFYVANDRWSKRQFKKLVDRGLAVEQSTEQPERSAKAKKKGKKKRKGKTKKRKDRRVAAPPGFRTLTTLRMWEPSLPSVVEVEEACFSPHHTPSAATMMGAV